MNISWLPIIFLLMFSPGCQCQRGMVQRWKEQREVSRALKFADTSQCDELVECPHDYYALFKVGRKASPLELKQARKSLLLKLHPDKNKDSRAGKAFDLAQKAYAELMDKQNRKNHDEMLQWREYVVAERRKEQIKTWLYRVQKAQITIAKTVRLVSRFSWKHRRVIGIGSVVAWFILLLRRLFL